MFPRRKVGALFFLLIIALFFMTGCRKKQNYKEKINFEEVQQQANANSSPRRVPLRIAVAPVLSPVESFKLYSELSGYIAQEMGRPVEFVHRSTYAEVNDLVRYGECDVAFVCDGAYLQGQQDFGMQLLVAPQVDGKTVYHSYIIVPEDSKATRFEELRGKIFAFSDPLSTSGHFYPLYLLWKLRETPKSFFKKYIFTYSHDNSIKAVAEKMVDGAAVDSLVYDYMIACEPDYYKAKTKVIQSSPPYGIPPVVNHPRIAPQLREQLKKVFLTMHQNKQGREILSKLMIDRFVEVDDNLYDSVREMAAKVGYPK